MQQEQIYVKDRQEWRRWLAKNYKTKKVVWLLSPKVSTGRKRILYNDAVEEALCFGWIDSNQKSINKSFSGQRFTPRNPKTPYSQTNKERLKRLAKQGKLMPEIRSAVAKVMKEKYIFPKDIIKKIQSNKKAWENFRKFPAVYQRIRVGFIDGSRKRPEEFKKRLGYFIKMTENGKMFGYGGIEKYF